VAEANKDMGRSLRPASGRLRRRGIAGLLVGLCGIGAITAALPRAAEAQDPPYNGKEFWPEIDVSKRLNARQTLLVQWTRSRGRDYFYREEGISAFFDHRFTPSFAARAGYVYIRGYQTPDDPEIEHRGILDGTFRKPFEGGWMLSDRNRVDLRWKEAGFSFRYRNRLTLEKTVRVGSYEMMPYGSAEAFFDSRYDTFSRSAYILGIQTPLGRWWMLDTYYAHQNDKFAYPRRLDALGMTLNLYL
jgi:hypothetical protein